MIKAKAELLWGIQSWLSRLFLEEKACRELWLHNTPIPHLL
jgi:hypothetical protein